MKIIVNKFKEILKYTPFYNPLRKWILNKRVRKQWDGIIYKWEKNQEYPIPSMVKRAIIFRYAKINKINIFVETGTYNGETVKALKHFFNKVYSIELSRSLYEKTAERFINDQNVEIIQGNSAKKLKSVLDKINEPALFWLDGHYSGRGTAKGDKDTPIIEELQQIYNGYNPKHIVLIDDMQCFGKYPNYPTTQQLKEYILSLNSDVTITIKYDIMIIMPKFSIMNKNHWINYWGNIL